MLHLGGAVDRAEEVIVELEMLRVPPVVGDLGLVVLDVGIPGLLRDLVETVHLPAVDGLDPCVEGVRDVGRAVVCQRELHGGA